MLAAHAPKCTDNPVRRDKLNSQFIVTKFSILHAGGWSLFRFQTSREIRMAMLELEIARAPPTNWSARESVAQGTVAIFYCIGSEI